jgi:TatA/E family protein of Tat protein translocase
MGLENPVHLLFIAAVALIVLGPRRLPELAKALGKGVREFRDAMSEGEDAESPASSNGAPPAPAATAQASLPAPGQQTPPPGIATPDGD